MARVCYPDHIKHIHGLVNRKEGKVIFKNYSPTGLNFLSPRPDYKDNPTAEQMAMRQTFKQAAAQVKSIMADVDRVATYKEAFKNQSKYATIRGFIFATVYASL